MQTAEVVTTPERIVASYRKNAKRRTGENNRQWISRVAGSRYGDEALQEAGVLQ